MKLLDLLPTLAASPSATWWRAWPATRRGGVAARVNRGGRV